jgi:uncharacterized small protein (DUF1192 family)
MPASSWGSGTPDIVLGLGQDMLRMVCRKRVDERSRLLEQETAALREEAEAMRRDAEKQAATALTAESRARHRHLVCFHLSLFTWRLHLIMRSGSRNCVVRVVLFLFGWVQCMSMHGVLIHA